MVRALGLALALLALPSAAAAHDDVDDGRRRYAEADFDGAIAAFARAEASPSLTRADLIALLEGRALAEYALEDIDAARVTVRRLASIAPDHAMGDEIPPELVHAFEDAARELGAGIALRVDPRWREGEVTVVPVLSGDVSGMVSALSVAGRAGDDGPWIEGGADGVTVPTPGDVAVWVHAAARGPGGAVLARVGSPTSPERLERPGGDEGLPDWAWGLVGGGAGLVALAVIVAVAVAASGSDGVQIAPPRLLPSGS